MFVLITSLNDFEFEYNNPQLNTQISCVTYYNNFLDIMLQSSYDDSSLKDVSPGESGIHDNFLLQNGM